MPSILLPAPTRLQKPGFGARVNPAHPLAQGLLGAWLMNEGGGAVARTDAPPNLTALGSGVAWVPGRAGMALAFDGTTNGRVTPGDILGGAVLPSTVTLVALVRLDTASTGGVILKFGGTDLAASADHGSGLAVGVGSGTFDADGNELIGLYENVAWKASGTSIGTGWHHLALTANGGTCELWLDGARVFNSSATAFLTSTGAAPHGTVFLGGYHTANGPVDRDIACVIDHALIYGRVLSGGEIASLATDPYQLFAPPVWRRYVVPPASVQTAAPIADVSVGSWTTDTGATTGLYAAIDEATAVDTDYIQSSLNPSNDEAKVRLGPLTDPAVGTGHVVRYRYLKDASGEQPIDLTITLYRADGTTAIRAATLSAIDAVTTGSFTLTTTEADSIPSGDYATGLVLGFKANRA